MKRLLIPLVVLALAGCGGVRTVVVHDAPTTTETETRSPTPDEAAQITWAAISPQDRQSMCELWVARPDIAEAAFKKDATDLDEADQLWVVFVRLLREECL